MLIRQGSADCSSRDKHTFGTVIVIGAGAAGMAAATRLMENGFNVTVLEAESRYGGRIQTIRHGSGVLDLGAQWYRRFRRVRCQFCCTHLCNAGATVNGTM